MGPIVSDITIHSGQNFLQKTEQLAMSCNGIVAITVTGATSLVTIWLTYKWYI